MIKVQYAEFDADHRGDFVFDIPGDNSWLIILTHTPAVFFVNNTYVEFPPNCLVVYSPKMPIYYRASSRSYSNDWVRFQTDEPYITESNIPFGLPITISDPGYFHKLFQLITYEHEKGHNSDRIIIEHLMQIIILKAVKISVVRQCGANCGSLQDLRDEIYLKANEVWSVKRMANKLNISTGYLETIYKKTFGVSCIEDVINGRILLAKKRLRNQAHTMREVCDFCGYRNAEHFFRQFKQKVGVTPQKYRQMYLFHNDEIQ